MTFLHRRLIYPGVARALGEGAMFRRLGELSQLQYKPREQLESAQAQRLSRLLSRATLTPYYRTWLDSRQVSRSSDPHALLRSLPVLSKRDLQGSFAQLQAVPRPSRVSVKVTGGSTGQAVTIMKDRAATAYERAAMWLGYGWHGVAIGDRAARFWGQPFGQRARFLTGLTDLAMNRIRFSAFAFDDESLEKYWSACQRFRPQYFHGYVSMLAEFAQFVLATGKDGLGLRLKSIIATSEVLMPAQRKLLESVFGCPVQVEYGCGEMGPIAYGCEKGTLHLLTPDVYVEFLRDDNTPAGIGETARLVLTDLNNQAMHLLRYDIGDYGIAGTPCDCGRGLPTLEKIWGRAYDVVVGPDGKKFHGEFFMYILEDIRRDDLGVSQFQVVQVTPQSLVFRVIANPQVHPQIAQRLHRVIEEHMPGMAIQLEWVGNIPRLPSGKIQIIENRWIRSAPQASSLS